VFGVGRVRWLDKRESDGRRNSVVGCEAVNRDELKRDEQGEGHWASRIRCLPGVAATARSRRLRQVKRSGDSDEREEVTISQPSSPHCQ
jgi:hypothetical protein